MLPLFHVANLTGSHLPPDSLLDSRYMTVTMTEILSQFRCFSPLVLLFLFDWHFS